MVASSVPRGLTWIWLDLPFSPMWCPPPTVNEWMLGDWVGLHRLCQSDEAQPAKTCRNNSSQYFLWMSRCWYSFSLHRLCQSEKVEPAKTRQSNSIFGWMFSLMWGNLLNHMSKFVWSTRLCQVNPARAGSSGQLLDECLPNYVGVRQCARTKCWNVESIKMLGRCAAACVVGQPSIDVGDSFPRETFKPNHWFHPSPWRFSPSYGLSLSFIHLRWM